MAWVDAWNTYVDQTAGPGQTYRDTLDTLTQQMRADMASPTLES